MIGSCEQDQALDQIMNQVQTMSLYQQDMKTVLKKQNKQLGQINENTDRDKANIEKMNGKLDKLIKK